MRHRAVNSESASRVTFRFLRLGKGAAEQHSTAANAKERIMKKLTMQFRRSSPGQRSGLAQAGIVAALTLSTAAVAQVPSASVYGDVQSLRSVPRTIISDSTWLTLSDVGTYAWYTVHSYGGLAPEVGAELHTAVPGVPGALYPDGSSIQAANTWWFKIGPKAGFGTSQTAGTPIPISFEYTIDLWGAAADDARWYGVALLQADMFGVKYVSGQGGTWTEPVRIPPAVGTDVGHHLESYTVGYNRWQRLHIFLEAGVSAGGPDELGDSASFKGFIDPSVLVDPAWLAAHPNDEIVFASVTTPIPEPPAILGGLLACMLALGARWRRFQRGSRPVPGTGRTE
jgi:hypothetical protein